MLLKRFSGHSNILVLKQSISTLDSSSKSIYFLGSSRIQRSVHVPLIQDSLKTWKVYNLGLLGNTLAQNLYLAQYIKKLPGNKVVFIELTPFILNYPETFKMALEYLELPNFPESYFKFLGRPVPPSKDYDFLDDFETSFWNMMIQNQNALKSIISQEDFNGYNEIGFSPTSRNDVVSSESFLSHDDLRVFSQSDLDPIMYDRVNQSLKMQQKNEFKVVYLLPVTSNEKADFEQKIPIFNKIPEDSKWEYQDEFLRMLANPSYLENKNHMNSRGAYIYSQGLVKYIKANENNWQ